MFAEYFTGKSVLITGVGQGVGRALAKRLHSYGAKVTGVGRTPSSLSSLTEECPGLETICVNLGDWNATRKALKGVGPFDYLVNNAALNVPGGVMDITEQECDSLFSVNIKGYLNVAQIVAEDMISAGIKGSILNVSSVAGLKPHPGMSLYCISKAGVDMITKLLAVELGPKGIRVNGINPAGIPTGLATTALTGMAQAAGNMNPDDFKTLMNARTPVGSIIMEMEGALNAILFMLSPASPMIHGEGLVMDGGFIHS